MGKDKKWLRNYLLRGFDSVSDVELLALVIGRSDGRELFRKSTELIERFGGVDGLYNADAFEITKVEGIGISTAVRIKASLELGRRGVLRSRENCIKKVGSPQDIANLMLPELKGLDREYFKAVLLNTKNAVIKIVTVAIGSLNAALVHPRETFKSAIAVSAASIVLVHNHPGGDPEPSREDKELTLRFIQAGKLLGIELLDHVILGNGSFVSLRERGLIRDY